MDCALLYPITCFSGREFVCWKIRPKFAMWFAERTRIMLFGVYPLLMLVAVAVGTPSPAAAASDAVDLPYSGRLVEDNGAPVVGPVDMLVHFYTSETGDTPIARGLVFDSVPLEDGVFQLKISLAAREFHKIFVGVGHPTWIQIMDETNGKTYPRQMLGAMPYALKVPVDGSTIDWNDEGQLQLRSDASVSKVAGETFVTKGAAPGQVLAWDNTSKTWKPANPGPTIANSIQGFAISATAPTAGQILSYDGTQWVAASVPPSVAPTISTLAAATATNTAANANFAQAWNWTLTGATTDGFTFGETTAATGGTGEQSVLRATTLATSTAVPLMITNLGDGASFRVNDQTGDADPTPFVIDSSGNIGIGTGAPSTLLHVTSGLSPAFRLVDGTQGIGKVLLSDAAGNASWGSVAGTGTVTNVTAIAPISVATGTSTPAISISQATASADGYLSSADWTTFNGKQPVGSYITALTGDVTAAGPGSSAGTISNSAVTTVKIADGAVTTVKALTTNPGINRIVGTDATTGSSLTKMECSTVGFVLSWTVATGWQCNAIASIYAAPVTSVASKTGAVTLDSADITDATNANTPNMLVKRDGNGDFGAGVITGNSVLTGALRVTGGTLAAGKVLTSDVSGNATWQAMASSQWATAGSDINYVAGNVGIGTTAPIEKLHVYAAAGNVTGRIESAASGNSYLDLVQGGGTVWSLINYNTGNAFGINNGADRLTILSSGNVGIGTTSPSDALEVNGGVKVANGNDIKFAASSGSANNPGDVIFLNNNGTERARINSGANPGEVLDFSTGASSTLRMRIDASGNVGFGITNPLAGLHVASVANTGTVIQQDGFEDGTLPPFTTGGDENWAVAVDSVSGGIKSARSGAIGASQSSVLSLAITLSTAGNVSFYRRVSTEAGCNCDGLSFKIDGVQQGIWMDGETPWGYVNYNLTVGGHTLSWEYFKDPATTGGSDAAWIDELTVAEGAAPLSGIFAGNVKVGGNLGVDGNVGIGTLGTPGPTQLLDIASASSSSQVLIRNTTISDLAAYSSPKLLLAGSQWNSATGPVSMSGGLQLNSYANNANPSVSKLSFLVGSDNGTPAELMSLLSTGHLGIGTTAPSSALEVAGQVKITGGVPGAGKVLTSDAAGLASWAAAPAGSVSGLSAASGTGTIDNTNYAQAWNWSTASTESPMTMSANGLTTGSLLNVTSSSGTLNSTNGLLNVANTGASTAGTVARIQSNSAAGSGFTVLANGNVGIGTTAPAAPLHVAAGLTTTGAQLFLETNEPTIVANDIVGDIEFRDLDSGVRSAARIRAISSGTWGADLDSAGTDLQFFTQDNTNTSSLASPRMTIDSVGNVGIGATSPQTTLHVAGQIFANPGVNTNQLSFDAPGINYGHFYSDGTNNNLYIGGSADVTTVPTSPIMTWGLGNGNVGIGTTSPSANLKLQVNGAVASAVNIIISGGVVDLSLSNVHYLKSVGGSVIALSNMASGGSYTVIIYDATQQTYTFTGCTNSYFSPTNGQTFQYSSYSILTVVDGANTNCFINWVTGFN
jgi:hypothetical protein